MNLRIGTILIFVACFLCACMADGEKMLGDLKISKDSFLETFDSPDSLKNWIQADESKSFKYIPDVQYEGKFGVEPASKPSKDIPEDKSLRLKSSRSLHGILRILDTPIVVDGTKDLVIQYELGFPSTMQCGGGYMKFLTFDNTSYNEKNIIENFDDEDTHLVVFGPDKCISNSRVHYFLSAADPKTSVKSIRHYTNNIAIGEKLDETNLYTIVIKGDGSFKVKINGNVTANDTIANFDPPIFPPEKIVDPNAVDPNKDYKGFVEDETAEKPADWDNDAPEFVADPTDTKPSNWLDSEEPTIPAPNDVQEALKIDWDEDLLGPFVPAVIDNPACVNGHCGPWSPKLIKNPDYRGVWSPPLIPNPVPPVAWDPPVIDNPDFIPGPKTLALGTINAVLIDIWTTDGNIEFDNIYVGYSEDEADAIAAKTYFSKPSSPPKAAHSPNTQAQIGTIAEIYISAAKFIFNNPHEALSIVKSRLSVYVSDPKVFVNDLVALRANTALTIVISAAVSLFLTSLFLIYCQLKYPSHKTKPVSPKQTPHSSSSKQTTHSSSSSSDNDTSSDSNDDAEIPPKNLKHRKANPKNNSSSKNSSKPSS